MIFLEATSGILSEGQLSAEPGRLGQVWAALETVTDPEIDQSVTSLGFTTKVTLKEEHLVEVEFRLPTYWCAPNFAFLMASDMRDAVKQLPWVKTVSITLLDHFSANLINQGVARNRDFRAAFPGETDGDLAEIRRKFLGQAFLRRQELLLRYLIKAGYAAAWIRAASLGELELLSLDEQGRTFRNLYLFIRRRFPRRGVDEDALAFVTEEGQSLDPEQMDHYLRRISSARHNAEFNGALCRSVLAVRNRRPKESPADQSPAACQ